MRIVRALIVAAVLTPSLACLGASSADAAQSPQIPIVRIEGANATLFEGPVESEGHDITTPSGGTHGCDGTNAGANPQPGDTMTATAVDAGSLTGVTIDGTFDGEFDDYFITRF